MVERKFIPGSEWLYLKIYTGVKSSDIILEEIIKPLTEYFQAENYITKWFFIRYNDPKPHLRIRFNLNNTNKYNKVFEKTNDLLQKYIDTGEISNVLLDIYKREIERYGQNTIKDAETLFWANSEFTLQCLTYSDEDKLLVSLFYIDTILNELNLSVNNKLNWIKDFNTAFKQEFNADKKLNSQLDKKYRIFKTKYVNFIQSDEFSEERNAIISNVKSNNTLKSIFNYNEQKLLELSLQDFFQSIFHMNINRIFVSNQRLFEMVIYDYLNRYYKSAVFV